ncbi:DUF2924 domain-containing protein [Xanthobacter sp. V7C-4]|uniref:DUF2924 domain-containing protein n=1 Tax=Xanthobacter autotrophicus (strain ATCC BAA-1158 / Py2) TaxID=78245 RepID=UPI00372672AD
MAVRPDPIPAASAAGTPLDEALAVVAAASLDQLRPRFRTLFRVPAPDYLSRDMVARLIAHRLQEQRLGKLDRSLAEQVDRLGRGQEPRRRLKAGTVLVREHDGAMHEVVVVPNGFLWNGTTFASLSTIAKQITGTSWNGPRFFGLRPKAKRQSPPTADAEVVADA